VTDISAFESRQIPELLGRDYARHAETVVPGGLMFYCRCFLFLPRDLRANLIHRTREKTQIPNEVSIFGPPSICTLWGKNTPKYFCA